MKKYIQTLLLLFLLCSVKDIFASPAKQINSWNNLSNSSTTSILQNGTQTLTDLNQALSINISSSNYAPKVAYCLFHNKKLLHSFYIMTLPLWYPIMAAYIIYTLFVLSVIIGILRYAKQKYEPKMSIDKLLDMPYQQPQAAITLPQPTITAKPSALLEKASENMEPQWAVACVSVYLAGMLSSYISSTWYHGSRPGKLKELLRKFDHGAIYLHIAGTYTPFTLLVLRHAGGWGWGIFAFVWLSAIAGFILSFKKLKEHSNLETACYVGMGACILVAMKPLLDHLGELGATTAFWWLIGGGVSYIVGAVFYSLRKPYMHATFHLFCLGGSIGHIIAIWLIL